MVLRWFYVSGDQAIDVKATKKPPQETSDESSQKKPPKISCLTKNLEIDLPKWRPKVPQNHSKSNPGPPGDPKMALLATIGSPGGFGTKFGAQSGHTMHPPGSQNHRKSQFRGHVFSCLYLAPTSSIKQLPRWKRTKTNCAMKSPIQNYITRWEPIEGRRHEASAI